MPRAPRKIGQHVAKPTPVPVTGEPKKRPTTKPAPKPTTKPRAPAGKPTGGRPLVPASAPMQHVATPTPTPPPEGPKTKRPRRR